jgi:hypothetical protein
MLCTPEAMQALSVIVKNGVAHFGCIAQAIVAAPDVAGRGVVEPAFRRVYDGICAYHFFDSYAPAKQWMDEVLDGV